MLEPILLNISEVDPEEFYAAIAVVDPYNDNEDADFDVFSF